MAEVIWFEGRFATPADARVKLDDPGYLLGDGVFATMRAYRGRCFRKAAHLADLAHGMALLELGSLERAWADLADEAAVRAGAVDAYVRITVTRGPVVSILSRPQASPSPELYEKGISTEVLDTLKLPFLDPRVKTTSYAAQLVARREAERRGLVEGILRGLDGSIASGSMANLFVVRGRALCTPPFESGARDGVTRRAVLEYATRLGFAVRVERIGTLADVDEAFFASTRVECLPIARIDGRELGSIETAKTLRAMLREEALA